MNRLAFQKKRNKYENMQQVEKLEQLHHNKSFITHDLTTVTSPFCFTETQIKIISIEEETTNLYIYIY